MSIELPYRQAASVFLLKKNHTTIEFLLVKKPRKEDTWQLPQGGIEAEESIEEAARRECKEEVQIEYMYLGTSQTVYTYTFPKIATYERGDRYCGQQVHFCFGRVDAMGTPKVDGNEIIDYTWVTIDQIDAFITRVSYKDCILQVYKEGILLL